MCEVKSKIREVKTVTKIHITGTDIIRALLKAGKAIPGDNIIVEFEVPRGGDYSGTKLYIDNDNPVIATVIRIESKYEP